MKLCLSTGQETENLFRVASKYLDPTILRLFSYSTGVVFALYM